MAHDLTTGWYIDLQGDPIDLDDWVHTLNEPFDPVAIKREDGIYVLKSSEFSPAKTAQEVREKALPLIARLNGALAILLGSRPVRGGGVRQVTPDGADHVTIFAEAMTMAFRVSCRATATILGPDGKPVEPSEPQPSAAQRWNTLAGDNDLVSDMLEQHGNATGWYEIYKTIELAEKLVGGEHKLPKLLGQIAPEFKQMRTTANYYRHARAIRPSKLIDLADALNLLNYVVRTVLERQQQQ